MSNRIQAFTIIELLVSMVIVSIVLSLVWSVYFFVRDYKVLIENKSESLVNARKVEYWIKRDLARAVSVEYSSGGLIVVTSRDTINYTYSNTSISRLVNTNSDIIDIGVSVSQLPKNGSLEVCLISDNHLNYCFMTQPHMSAEMLLNMEE